VRHLLGSLFGLAATLVAQEPHWSFAPPATPAVPTAGESWARNAIDRFVAAEHAARGLAPEPEADRETLIRRVSLDLTGLPPTRAALEAFVADPSPDAYEAMVEGYLADPAYGERWATVWLDLARYADSKGFEKDLTRTIWPWRDWVVRALNEDLPFDRFSELQLAGDLLPNADDDARLATAFHRNTMTNDEGGTDDEEFRTLAVKDRVETTFQVWMGLTMQCARCHAHKYDPISTQDYYGAYAIFDQTADADRYDESPLLAVPSEAQRAELAKLDARIAERRAEAARGAVAWGGWEKSAMVADATFGVVPAELSWSSAAELRDAEALPLAIPAGSALYLRRTLRCSEPTSLGLAFGSDDTLCVWIDGERVLEHAQSRGLSPASEELQHAFAAGEHELLLQVRNTGGPAAVWFSADAELAALTARRAALEKDLPRVPVLQELPAEKRRATKVHRRGSFLDQTEPVAPALPAAFGPHLEGRAIDRLALARWLVAPENPLSARVFANRLWARLFGRGLVETEEDFGTQGAKPTHPELLDWLAREVHRRGWSQKELLRLLLLSATYRQRSECSAEKLARDRWNLWLARGPRTRLTAEMVRDQALLASGLLSRKLGGPPVFPPQPPGIWQVVYDAADWKTSEGEDRYRRALYTYWRRSSPYPTYQTLDAPTRDLCAPRRFGTITPLQALIAWNDPAFQEAAQALARRIAREEEGLEAQLRAAFLHAATRAPFTSELDALLALHARRLAAWSGQREDARRFACEPLGPLEDDQDPVAFAALTACCSALLNSEACWGKG
jgi:hypothetical protein